MSQIQHMADYIQRHIREVNSRDVTAEELNSIPYWQFVWKYWEALQHFEGSEPSMTMDECKAVYGS